MTKTVFEVFVENTLKHEGYYTSKKDVFDLKDGAGFTHKSGITQAAYARHVKVPVHKITRADMEAINLSTIEVIMKNNYWDACHADELPAGLALSVADMGYNAGPAQAIKLLQKLVKAEADGVFGPKTKEAVEAIKDPKKAVQGYCKLRIEYYKKLSQFERFGKGWTNRANDTKELSLGYV